MPSYAWRCFACEATNRPADEACERCGCPASPGWREVEQARAAWRRRSGEPPGPSPGSLLAQLPWLAIAAVLLALAGTLFLILGDMDAAARPIGGLLLALAALCAGARRPRG